MEESHAAGRRLDVGYRIASADGRPVDVELDLDLGRELGEEHVPDRRSVEWRELEGVIVVAEPDPLVRKGLGERAKVGREAPHVVDGLPVALRHPGHDHASTRDLGEPIRDGARVLAQAFDVLVRGNGPQLRHLEQPRELARDGLGQARELHRPIAGRRDGAQGSRQVVRKEPANRVELERDLVMSHRLTIRHRLG